MKGDREIICDDGTGPGKQKRKRITHGKAAEWKEGDRIVDSGGNELTVRVFQTVPSVYFGLYHYQSLFT